MNNTIYYDSPVSDDQRRQLLFEGQLFVYSPRRSTLAFIEHARQLIAEAFAPVDPEKAQYNMPVEQYAQILGKLKPSFIHHPESKAYLKAIFKDFGCDIDKTYFDVPKMRSSTSDKYLTTGIAYAWHPHRDTWYAAPMCQINWWIPIYEIQSNNAMAFHPRYWSTPVRNDSNKFNYYEWNKMRGPQLALKTKEDDRPLSKPVEPIEMDPQIRLICQAGGLIMFSGAQLHSSVPNSSGVTRFSIDFRTVHYDDALAKNGAPNHDTASTGTTMRDYLRATDLANLPDEIVALYDDGTSNRGDLVYRPTDLNDAAH
jgi:hypothetical protein